MWACFEARFTIFYRRITHNVVVFQDWFMATGTNRRFFATGRADQYSACWCELARGDAAVAAMRNGSIAMLTHYQSILVSEVGAVESFPA